jgi:hypothetical protein
LLKQLTPLSGTTNIHQQQPAIHVISKDSNGTIVIPIMDHTTQKIGGCSLSLFRKIFRMRSLS